MKNTNNMKGTIESRNEAAEAIMLCLEEHNGQMMSCEEITDWCIENEFTYDYPRGKEDGHPFFPTITVMTRKGNRHYEPTLNRKKVYNRETNRPVYVYWLGEMKMSDIYTLTRRDTVKRKKNEQQQEVKKYEVGERVFVNGRWLVYKGRH